MFFSARLIHFGIFGFSLTAMVIAYFFFQTYLELDPCPMCVSQRLFMILAGAIALLAVIHNPAATGQRIYSGAVALAALVGASVSARQLWLQQLPEDQLPSCGPSLEVLIDVFPFKDVLNALFIGEGSCGEVKWQLLGISIPGWTLLAFMAIILASAFVMLRRR